MKIQFYNCSLPINPNPFTPKNHKRFLRGQIIASTAHGTGASKFNLGFDEKVPPVLRFYHKQKKSRCLRRQNEIQMSKYLLISICSKTDKKILAKVLNFYILIIILIHLKTGTIYILKVIIKLWYSHTTEHKDFKSHVFKQFLRIHELTQMTISFKK